MSAITLDWVSTRVFEWAVCAFFKRHLTFVHHAAATVRRERSILKGLHLKLMWNFLYSCLFFHDNTDNVTNQIWMHCLDGILTVYVWSWSFGCDTAPQKKIQVRFVIFGGDQMSEYDTCPKDFLLNVTIVFLFKMTSTFCHIQWITFSCHTMAQAYTCLDFSFNFSPSCFHSLSLSLAFSPRLYLICPFLHLPAIPICPKEYQINIDIKSEVIQF